MLLSIPILILLSMFYVCNHIAIIFPDMTFTHDGNKTFIDSLVNFEKMVRPSLPEDIDFDMILDWKSKVFFIYIFFQRMIANTVRIVRYCRSLPFSK